MNTLRILLFSSSFLFSLGVNSQSPQKDSLKTSSPNNQELEQIKLDVKQKIVEQKYVAALDILGKTARLNPYDAELKFLTGYVKCLMGSYSLAFFDLTDALNINKNYVEALYFRGIANEKINQYAEAIIDFSKLYKLTKLDSILKLRGRVKFEYKDYNGAIQDFLAIKDTSIKEINHYAGKAYVCLNDYSNAEKQFMNVLARDPENDSVYVDLLKVLRQQKKYTEILDICKGIYFKKPIHYDIQAEAYVNLKKDSAALAIYDEVIFTAPSSERYYERANINLRRDSVNKAVADFNKSLEMNASQYDIHKKIANIYIEQKSFKNAIRTLNKAINIEPGDPDLFTYRGVCQYYDGDIKLAERDFAQSLKLNENGTLSVLGLVACKIKSHKYVDAKKALEMPMKIAPENGTFYVAASAISIAKRDFEKAREFLDIAKTKKVRYELALPLVEAYLSQSQGKYEDAIKQYDAILEKNIYGEKKIYFKEFIYKEKAKCFYKLKKYDKSIQEYEKVSIGDLFFTQEEIQTEIGRCYQAQGQNYKALASFDQVVKMNPMNEVGLILRGYSWYKLMKFDKAEEDLMRAVDIGSKNIQLLSLLSIVLLEQNKIAKFEDLLDKFSDKMKGDPKFFYINAMRFYYKKDYNNAIKILTNNIGTEDNPEEINLYIYNMLGNSYKRMNKFEEAYQFFDKAIELSPEAQDVLLNKGETLLLDRKYDQAIDILTQVLKLSENSTGFLYRAQSYQALNEKENACKDYRKAGELGNKQAFSTLILYCN